MNEKRPLPYKIVPCLCARDCKGVVIVDSSRCRLEADGRFDRSTGELIVRACNNFEQLLDACQNALITAKIMQLPRLDSRAASDEELLEILIAELEAALAAAEVKDTEEEKTQQIYDPVSEQWIEVKE